jgi:EAL domain-containing protein (putative c-di-GMP-specific phosphodiesterase class I)
MNEESAMSAAESSTQDNSLHDLLERAGIALEEPLREVRGHLEAHVMGMRLTSVFQPIADAGSGRVIGYEALLRARAEDRWPLAPEAVFALTDDPAQMVRLDRLCRTLHAVNFSRRRPSNEGDLYLNLYPQHLRTVSEGHGAFFDSILEHCGLSPTRVVLEVLESGLDDVPHLEQAMNNYRERGYRIAIVDFGRRYSKLDRLWRFQPEHVKLDRSLIAAASENAGMRRLLPGLFSIIHDAGALTVFEGIETFEQLALARDTGADAVQGNLVGHPTPSGFQSLRIQA